MENKTRSDDTLKIGEIDGKDVIYDEEGRLIPHRDEKILKEKNEVYCEVRKICKSKFRYNRNIFLWGEGKLYETNKRLVFIRDAHHLTLCPPPPIGPLIPPTPVRQIDDQKKEYFQVRLDEIINWKRGLFNKIRLMVEDEKDNEYKIYIKGIQGFSGTIRTKEINN